MKVFANENLFELIIDYLREQERRTATETPGPHWDTFSTAPPAGKLPHTHLLYLARKFALLLQYESAYLPAQKRVVLHFWSEQPEDGCVSLP